MNGFNRSRVFLSVHYLSTEISVKKVIIVAMIILLDINIDIGDIPGISLQ